VNLVTLVNDHPADARAICDGDVWHTWGALRRRAAAVAAGLQSLGVVAGDRVAVAWPTSVDFVIAYLGVLAAGAVCVPLNPNSPAAELADELDAMGPVVVLVGGAAAALADALVGSPARHVVVPESRLGSDLSWEQLSAPVGGDELPVAPREDDDLAVLLFTSGTAGSPKAAMLTHGNLTANWQQMLALPGEIFRSDDIGLAAFPLFHIFGLNVALGLVIATGASLVLQERFDAAGSLRLVRDLGVTSLLGVPAMFSAWADLPEDPEGAPLSGVRRAIAGAAALPVEVSARFEQRYSLPVWQGYGLTEASPAVATSLGTDQHRPGSVGRPLPGVEMRLVDDSGEDVLAGDPGEIWVKGPNVFTGYWRDPDATARVVVDGWLHTGDIGVVGDEGDLFVVDRKKDVIIVAGFNVFPAEVERVIDSLAGVAESVVLGRPDPITEESVEAVVVTEPGVELRPEDVRAHCQKFLAHYKCPSTVRFVAELPRGLIGKALRRALRDEPVEIA
jgi:long-chain acyl-CoA synthetase